jgi:hypothetical protein
MALGKEPCRGRGCRALSLLAHDHIQAERRDVIAKAGKAA